MSIDNHSGVDGSGAGGRWNNTGKWQGTLIIIILIGIFAAVRFAVATREHARRWEYKIMGMEDYESDTVLKKLGDEGWELASARRAVAGEGSQSRGIYECIFKRPIVK